ncbi:MAG: arginine decarboxylase [Peptococcia bacterium]
MISKISEYITKNKLGFHTPGHQQGRGMNPTLKKILGNKFLLGDLTEVPGLDNLRNPEECLAESQALAAELFGACKSFFLLNGSTVGIEAAILGLNRRGGKVLVARNSHISVINGLILSGGQPVLSPVVIEPKWGIPLGPDLTATKELVDRTVSLELATFTQPSYQGVGLEAHKLRQVIGPELPILCDEAHGAHLFFQEQLAMSAQKERLDIVVQSTHKTLGALTQASMLHVNRPKLIQPIQEAIETLQTTSPSYLLMASLDGVQDQMRREGSILITKSWELAQYLRAKIKKIGGYVLLEEELAGTWETDPSKLVLSAAGLGLTGWELAQILNDKYGIIIELSDYYYCLILITIGHSKQDIVRLCRALADIKNKYSRKPLSPLDIAVDMYNDSEEVRHTPRVVFQEEKDRIALNKACGRIAGQALTVYPPGIPLIWPGQVIKAVHLEYLEWVTANGLPVHGLDRENKIAVLAC